MSPDQDLLEEPKKEIDLSKEINPEGKTEGQNSSEIKTKLNIDPVETVPDSHIKLIKRSKGLIIAIVFVVIAVIIGVSALIGMNSSSQYQGLIQQVEDQTEKMSEENQTSMNDTYSNMDVEKVVYSQPLPVSTTFE